MSIPLLATKLYVPPPPPTLVPRPRLLEQLNAGLSRKLTLLAAPAGFGKTTLVSTWVAGCARPVAWLALDAADREPVRFLTYLVAALQSIAPPLGADVLAGLRSPQPPPTEVLLTALLNDLTTLPHKVLLVLDDYHVLEAPAVDAALTFLLDHLPPQLHLVLTTREDPPLPLARYRARGHLTELRAGDLRFTAGEAACFLNQVMGLDLAAADVTALETRTEGWIAGLQLAALSMQGRADLPGFIRAFTGTHRYIVDYLVEEVVQRQPAAVRHFLLETAILERLSGPLCEAVTGQPEGQARLEALERGNFFVVPLDDGRHWYRYHHLFAEVLAAQLQAEQPAQVATLHRRASVWYEQQGARDEAIRHALAAADFARAADLVEQAMPAMFRSRQEAALRDWLKALPDALIQNRPVLSVGYAHALLAGALDGVEARLRDAERWLDPPADRRASPSLPTEMVVVDQEEFHRLPGAIAVARAGLALAGGNVAATIQYARQALALVPEDDHLRRGSAAVLLGLASWTRGDLAAAHRSYAAGMTHLQQAGHFSDVIGCSIALADIQLAQGRLHEARRIFERGLQLAPEQHPEGTRLVLRGTADMHVGLGEIHREQNDLEAATQHLLHSQELGEHTGLPQNRYRWCVAMARLQQIQGDLDGALALLDEAERRYVSDFSPNVRPVAAWKTRVWAAQGRLDEALDWAREQGLSVADDPSYLRECEHITLDRVLLACYKRDQGAGADRASLEASGLMAFLERLRQAAEAGERTGSVIEILLLQALALQAQADIPAALTPLHRALRLAAPEGYVRLFVDEGPPMAQLLLEAAARGIMPDYAGKLVAAFRAENPTQPKNADQSVLPSTAPATPAAAAPLLIESLSERELEVLRLLGTELNGPEVAHALTVSLSTLRTHTRNIYNKLGVGNRRAAVRRGEELHLL